MELLLILQHSLYMFCVPWCAGFLVPVYMISLFPIKKKLQNDGLCFMWVEAIPESCLQRITLFNLKAHLFHFVS